MKMMVIIVTISFYLVLDLVIKAKLPVKETKSIAGKEGIRSKREVVLMVIVVIIEMMKMIMINLVERLVMVLVVTIAVTVMETSPS